MTARIAFRLLQRAARVNRRSSSTQAHGRPLAGAIDIRIAIASITSSAIVVYAAAKWLQHDPIRLEDYRQKDKTQLISMSEVEKHSKRDDLWLIVNGRVYDFTKVGDIVNDAQSLC